MPKITKVAFDLGGVLAYRDLSVLTEEEKMLLNVYMNRRSINDKELIEYASTKIQEIYLKIHKLTPDAIPTLEMLRSEHLTPSIWTNNIREIDNWFEEIGLYRYIDRKDIINSFYIGCDKPNIEFYKRALEIVKKHNSEVLFIDDSEPNVEGAAICGIPSIVYDDHHSLIKTVEKGIRK